MASVIICSSLKEKGFLFEPLFEEMVFRDRWETGISPSLVIGKEGGALFTALDSILKEAGEEKFPVLFLYRHFPSSAFPFLSYPLKAIDDLPIFLSVLLESLSEKRVLPLDRVLHRIRSPLSTALLNCELLEGEFPLANSGTGRIVRSLERNLMQIERIVFAHLKAFRSQSTIRERMEEVDLKPIVEKVCYLLEPKCRDRAVGIHLQLAAEKAICEPLAIEEILHVVLENAVLYTERGSTVSLTSDRKDDFLEIVVADQGEGIEKNERQKIFKKFYRSPRTTKLHPEGSGLGLYIARSLVQTMAGNIRVRKGKPKGSQFVISIPQQSAV